MKITNLFKRFASLVLCAVFLLGMVPAYAEAQTAVPHGSDNQNLIIINMTDSCGDGWSGNGFFLFENGNIISNATIEEGSSGSWSYMMDPDKVYALRWCAGDYPQECSFEIVIGTTVVFTATNRDCQEFTDGLLLYPFCAHEKQIFSVAEATCTEGGLTLYRCILCDSMFRADRTDPLGHTPGDETVVVPPTCTERGYTSSVCAVCGTYYEEDFVDALGHTPSGEAEVVPPTCTEFGYTWEICPACGDIVYDDYLPMLGHTLGEDGNCIVCGDPFTVPLVVAGVEVTLENYQDILGDGTASFDPETNTLTLNNFRYEGTAMGVSSMIPLNIVLEGSNTMINTDSLGFYFDTMGGDIRFSGTGTLVVDSDVAAIDIYNEGDTNLTFSGSICVTITTNNQNGIYMSCNTANLLVEDDVQLTVGTEDDPVWWDPIGVYGNTANLTVTDNAYVKVVSSDREGIDVDGDTANVTISGGTVDARGDFAGIAANCITVTGGKLTASGNETGICVSEALTVTGGTVEVLSGGLMAKPVEQTDAVTVTLGEHVHIVEPEGAFISDSLLWNDIPYTGIVDAEGNKLEAFVITCTHNWADGKCSTCGIPFAINASGFTLSFEDEILVNLYYTVFDSAAVTEQGMLVFYRDPGEADISMADDIYTGSATDGSVFMNTTRGIAAKYMGDERYYCAYAKLTDGTYAYSPLYQYSPQKYALGRIANSSNDKLKALCVAMLNYGAAAQTYFGYRTDDLMNADLTAQQQALVVSYDAGLFTGAVAADPAKTGSFVKTATGFSKKNASVSFEGAFAINYYFTPEFAVDGEVTLYVWDRETYEAVETLTADNASATVMTEQNGTWFASVSGIAPKDLDKTYYVAGVYTDAAGNTYCTGIIAYSLSRYCMNNANKSMGTLAQATAMYGYYAKSYFEA